MADGKIKWTEQQKRAVSRRGSDVLVTASAGTGKTAVLSGRCVDIVSDKSVRTDLRSMLVLTFTEMAAEQMRSRIAEQLRTAFAESGERHLRYQLMLLDAAEIGTIHSFCKRLITEHFYKLGLDPTFGIIDADEQKLFKAKVLEKTIDWAWQQDNLRAGLEQLFNGRDLRINDGFLAKIISLSDFLDGATSRENWYERATLLAGAVEPFGSDLGQKQKKIVEEKLQHILSQLRHAQKLCRDESGYGDWSERLEETHIRPIRECIEFLRAGDWNSCTEAIRNFVKPITKTPEELDKNTATLIHDTAKNAVDSFKTLSQFAVINPDYLDKVGAAVSGQTRMLVELVKKFDRLYSQAKTAVNRLDFADLEHYALKLLTSEDSSENEPLPSQTALELRRRYKYMFVDEYQDINAVQKAILKLLSGGDNLFVVGDVKQSIYAFRGAEPGIFIKELKSASSDEKNTANGLRVELNANWRSDKGILDFVNKIFSRVMTASFTGVDYGRSAQLKPAPQGKPEKSTTCNEPVVELHILDEQTANSKEKLNADLNIISPRQRQAAMIARRIKKMVGAETGEAEFQIYDKHQDKSRDVQYRDIVILMRSLAGKANDYVEVLRLAGVPVSCEAAVGYFEATEISDVLCALKVVDNPQRDIELAAVLRSQFFRFSDSELAKIKGHKSSGLPEISVSFYDCVLEYCASGADAELADKLKNTLARIEQWRTLGRRGSLADLIWQMYRQVNFLAFVSALPNGRARRANLLKLHDRAIQFAGFAGAAGIPSLSRFVEFIEKLQETGRDWAPAEPDSSSENAVRIISVHKSKGLEFPVVFLAELESKFNKRDIQNDCLADVGDTLGLQIIDRKSNSRLDSLAHQVIAEQKLSIGLAEEMRILYVAATRARDRLVLTASQSKKSCHNIVRNGFYFSGQTLPDWQLRSCRSHLEWVLYGLSKQANLHEALETSLAEKSPNDDLFSIKFYDQTELKRLSGYILKLRNGKLSRPAPATAQLHQKPAESELLGQVKRALEWQYEFGDVSLLPAKLSVTQLTHGADEYAKPPFESPVAGYRTRPTSGDIGSATHLVIANLDLNRAVNKEAIEQTKEKLLADGAITETIAEQINVGSIIDFFDSELGRAALDSKNKLWREWPFTFTIPACESADSGDEIIVQGIIDMLVQTPDGLLVIDFKTDNITAQQISQRAENYRRQLELYARAAAAILKPACRQARSETTAKWLYFLTPGCAIEVK